MTLRTTAVVLLASALLAAPVRAEKLDKDSKKWLDDVTPLLLSEEGKAFKDLKDKADRDEFQKIFWARRNPQGPASTDNPAKAEYDKLKAEIEKRFKVPGGGTATLTDCARVFVLLGEPSEVKKDQSGETATLRAPEIWTFKDRPGFKFPGGQIQVPFDDACRLPAGSHFAEQLGRPAEARIVSPNIGYKMTADHHLTKLAELLPKPTPAQALLKEPRQDFPVQVQSKLVMRGKDGVYLAGLIRGEAAGLTTEDEGGKKRVAITVAAQALDEGGHVVASTPEQDASVELASDGSFVGSYGLTLKPGRYTLRAGALEGKSSKGSVASLPLEVPDFASGETAISDPIVLADVVARPAQDPKDPLAAFFMGTAQLIPRFGNVFTKAETIQVLAFVYDPQTDPATGKPQIATRFSILKDGKPMTSTSEDDIFDTPISTPGIGPVPLAKFAPGTYTVQLRVTDRVAKKDYTKAATFEVR
jgi:GWxTD domain-containing protein